MSYTNHISEYMDLTTTYAETRAGFISMALEKNKKATPYIEEAKVLRNRIKDLRDPYDLIRMKNIRKGLIAAAGISDKASRHLGIEGCEEAISLFTKNFLIPAGEGFRDELIYRFLLTKGDSLGGSMRNIVGTLAKNKVTSTIIASLRMSEKKYFWKPKLNDKWIAAEEDFNNYEDVKGLSWENDKGENRVLLYDTTVKFVGNNIDLILLQNSRNILDREAITDPNNYIALGELKGGIDPAGADEHWKTAKTALDRINHGFNEAGLNPQLFFIGAAIENRMAEEIHRFLETGFLTNVANLTKDTHMTSICDWLIYL